MLLLGFKYSSHIRHQGSRGVLSGYGKKYIYIYIILRNKFHFERRCVCVKECLSYYRLFSIPHITFFFVVVYIYF